MSTAAALFPQHPCVPDVTEADILAAYDMGGDALLQQMMETRNRDIANFEQHPFEHPFRIEPMWTEADKLADERRVLVMFGGNRSSKTRYCIEKAVRQAVNPPGGKPQKILCLMTTDKRSKTVHQDLVFRLLPVEWQLVARSTSRRKNTKLSFKEGDGFTDNLAILPNRSRIEFGFYTADVKQYEGDEYDLIVADEDFPLAWLKTLLVRLYTRRGKLLWPFTPINGITPAVAHVTRGARTERSERAEMLSATHRAAEDQDWPAGHMPIVQINTSIPGAPPIAIMYFWSQNNPFANYADMRADFAKAPTVDTERRLYGYCRDAVGTVFGKFGSRHILAEDWTPDTAAHTGWQVMDPASRRNPFILWGVVDAQDRLYVTHEWPDRPTYGEWAITSDDPKLFDGAHGPATVSVQWGVPKFKVLFDDMEQTRPVFFRYIDPRFGNAEQSTSEAGGSTLREKFSAVGIHFDTAPGVAIEIGEREIIDMLDFDDNVVGQEPRLFIHPRCQNLIDALRNYTGRDGEKGAQKDPIDCLRYITLAKPCHVGNAKQAERDGGGW
jgi:hypothetical protein